MNYSFGSKIFITLLFVAIFVSFFALCAAIWPGVDSL